MYVSPVVTTGPRGPQSPLGRSLRALAIHLANAEADVLAARRAIDGAIAALEGDYADMFVDGTPQIVRNAYGQGAL